MISNTDSETVLALSNPSIGLAKSANPTTVTAAGQMVTYSFVVTNTGNVTLAGVSVSDPLPGLTSINCPVSTLAPGSSTVCTPGYVVTLADINAGAISNTATVAGTPKAGSAVGAADANTVGAADANTVGAADANTVVAAATPAILIVKSTNPSVVTAAGQNVGYSFVVTSPTSIAA